jgi:hypothetical protein
MQHIKKNKYGRQEISALELFKLLVGVIYELLLAGVPFSAKTVTDKAREDNPDIEIPHEQSRGITYALFSASGGNVRNPGTYLYQYEDLADDEGQPYRVYSERPEPLHALVERLIKLLVGDQVLNGVEYDIDDDGFIYVPLSAVSRWAVANHLPEAERDQFRADLKVALKNNGGHAAEVNGRPAMAVKVEDNFLDLDDDEDFLDDIDDDEQF